MLIRRLLVRALFLVQLLVAMVALLLTSQRHYNMEYYLIVNHNAVMETMQINLNRNRIEYI